MAERCVNLRDWESRHLLHHDTLTLVRPVKLVVPYVMDEREDGKPWPYATTWSNGDDGEPWMPSPFGRTGDTLIGREAWLAEDLNMEGTRIGIQYRATPAPKCRSGNSFPKSPGFRFIREVQGGCGGMDSQWRSAATMPAWAARHRMNVESVEVKKCTDVFVCELSGGAPPPYYEVSAAEEWPEKRFPWATSYAWVVKVRRSSKGTRWTKGAKQWKCQNVVTGWTG